MRIGINALYLLPGRVGGSETYVRNLLRYLPRIDRNAEYVVFCNQESAGVFASSDPAITVVACPVHATHRPQRILWEQFILPRYVKRHSIDILLSAGMTAPVRCPATSVVMVFDLQHINQPANFPLYYLPFLRSIIYASAKSADGILTISRQVKSDIVRFYHVPPDRVKVTYLAVDHEAYSASGPPSPDEIRKRYGLPDRFLLYAASSLPHKNHARLLEAFRIVRIRFPDLKLVLIGARDKGYATLARTIDDAGLIDAVILLGWVPFDDVPAIYRACRAFVFPTLHEGFGLPVIEAMACGVPVVCSRIEPLLEIAGDAARFVDPLSPADIADGISSVVPDAPLRRQLIEAGASRCLAFTWENTARETSDFLRTVHAVRGRNR